jgi:hypothetical protein
MHEHAGQAQLAFHGQPLGERICRPIMHPFRPDAHIDIPVPFVHLDHINSSSRLILRNGETRSISEAVQADGKAKDTLPKQQFLHARPNNPGMYPPPFHHAFHLDAISVG